MDSNGENRHGHVFIVKTQDATEDSAPQISKEQLEQYRRAVQKYITISKTGDPDDEVVEFISRRFKTDCDWIEGNCYYFAKILSARFPKGEIFYDVIAGHFMFKYKNKYYDWTGEIRPEGTLVKWSEFKKYDSAQRKVIIRDCVK